MNYYKKKTLNPERMEAKVWKNVFQRKEVLSQQCYKLIFVLSY